MLRDICPGMSRDINSRGAGWTRTSDQRIMSLRSRVQRRPASCARAQVASLIRPADMSLTCGLVRAVPATFGGSEGRSKPEDLGSLLAARHLELPWPLGDRGQHVVTTPAPALRTLNGCGQPWYVLAKLALPVSGLRPKRLARLATQRGHSRMARRTTSAAPVTFSGRSGVKIGG